MTLNKDVLLDHLRLSETVISHFELRIGRQIDLIERLDAQGLETRLAKETLKSMQGLLDVALEHRELILKWLDPDLEEK